MTIAPEPAPAPTYSQPPAPPKRRWGRIVLIVVAAVIALIVVFGVAVFFLVNESTEDAQKVSDQLVTAVQNGDGAAAYALTGPAFRAATTEAQLTELVQNLSTLVTKDKSSPSSKAISVEHRERQDRRLHLHDEGHQRQPGLLQDPDPRRGRKLAGDELPQLRITAHDRRRVSVTTTKAPERGLRRVETAGIEPASAIA